ncbi:MAG: desulfoferrodoxin [Candidatus Pacebacteria bacterium]|nr:desulfoferrodoxin [Candidatus Paceibacterota bacterium]
MTQLRQIYKCDICGNVVEVLHPGAGELVCCGQPMRLLEPKTRDEGQEKHIPVVEKTEKGIKVKVGSIPHPMEESHFIQWIQATADGKTYFSFLKPGEPAEAEFPISANQVTILEYCNLHGLWQEQDKA